MFEAFPRDPKVFMQWSLKDVKAYTDDLARRELSAESVREWVRDWSDVCRVITEMFARLWTATSINTADGEAKEHFNTFLGETYTPWMAANQELKQKLLESGLQIEGFELALRNLAQEAEIFRAENLPLLAEEKILGNEYDELIGAQTVLWEGEELTLTQLQLKYLSFERAEREQAWQLEMGRKLADRQKVNDVWVKLFDVRCRMAEQAGFENYREYRWKELLRFDYTPQDCLNFHQAIEEVVVPAARRIYAKRQGEMGLDSLRPWDLTVDPRGRPALKPFKTIEELVEKVSRIFHQLDPELGEYFESMRSQGLLDLENRKDKAPGAYCIDYDMVMQPFIFANAVGLHVDVSTLIHESGHAFHVFEEANLPYFHQLRVGMEFGEVASSSMELLATPYLVASKGGFYSEQEARRATIEFLEEAILFWPYMAVVDGFQHWAYTHSSAARETVNCDKKWRELWQKYMIGVDWGGLEDALVTGWQRKQHIFGDPFYYVEYGMAYLGTFQVWENSLRDEKAAVAAYRRALRLGGTASLPRLYEVAGAKFAFDAEALERAVRLAEGMIERLEG